MIHRRAGWRGSIGDFMPMPAHQDGREACGQFLREMRWSHLNTGSLHIPRPLTPRPETAF
jgi:hypothetical protein